MGRISPRPKSRSAAEISMVKNQGMKDKTEIAKSTQTFD